jgi:hypothetical protein
MARYKFVNCGGINWTWLLCYEEVQGGARIVFYDRWHNGEIWPDWVDQCYEMARGSCTIKEAEGRKAVALLFPIYEARESYPGSKHTLNYFVRNRELSIVNQGYIFAYGMQGGLEEVRKYLSSSEFGCDLLCEAVFHLQRLELPPELPDDGDWAAIQLLGLKFEEVRKES